MSRDAWHEIVEQAAFIYRDVCFDRRISWNGIHALDRARKCAERLRDAAAPLGLDVDEVIERLGPAVGATHLRLWRLTRVASFELSDESVRPTFVEFAEAFVWSVQRKELRLAIASALACAKGKAEWDKLLERFWYRVMTEARLTCPGFDFQSVPWPPEVNSLRTGMHQLGAAWLHPDPLSRLTDFVG